MTIHPNSSQSYAETVLSRSCLEDRIMSLMADNVARTDREIQHALGLSEKVNPRITTLVDAGDLLEVGSKICEFTHRKVRLVRRFL